MRIALTLEYPDVNVPVFEKQIYSVITRSATQKLFNYL